MSEHKFTPGPWFTDTEYSDGEHFTIYDTRYISNIAHVVNRVRVVGEDDIEKGPRISLQSRANAKLIAASPENLHEHIQCVELLKEVGKIENFENEHRELFLKIVNQLKPSLAAIEKSLIKWQPGHNF